MARREIPPVELINREVEVYDPALRKWLRGRRIGPKVPLDLVKITWTNTGANTNVTPDHDAEIDVTYAKSIAIQVDTTATGNTSNDFDVNVMADVGDGIFDTVPYAEANIGDAEVKTFLVTPGIKRIRLRGDNNAAASTGYVTARVFIIE